MKKTLYIVCVVASLLLTLKFSPATMLEDPVWQRIMSRELWIALWVGLSGVVGSWMAWRLCKPRLIREYLYCALLTWLFTQILLGIGVGIYGAILSNSDTPESLFAESVGFGIIYFFVLFYYFCYLLPLSVASAAITCVAANWGRGYRLSRIKSERERASGR